MGAPFLFVVARISRNELVCGQFKQARNQAKQPTTMNLEGQRRLITNFCAPVGQQFITLLNVEGEVVSDTGDGIVFELDEKDRGRLPSWTHGRIQFTEHDAEFENCDNARDLFLERTRKV